MPDFKGYKPTPRRLEKARREGKVLKGHLITQLSSIVALLAGVAVSSRLTWVKNRILLEYCWSEGFEQLPTCSVGIGRILLEIVIPSLFFASFVSFVVESVQIGFRFNPALAAPRASGIDVVSGLKRMGTGVRGSWQLALRIGFIIFLVAYWFFPDLAYLGALLWSTDGDPALPALHLLQKIAAVSIGGLCIFAALDYSLRRREFYRELSMSMNDLRQEQREDEGEPLVKAQRQSLYRTLTYSEFVARARKSAVIVVGRAVH